MKIRTLTVSFPHYDDSKDGGQARVNAPRVYRVEKVTESVIFSPLQQLSKQQVEELCNLDTWKVTVVPAHD